jgi:hypothetical protein
VFFAVFSLLRGNLAGAIAGLAAALTLGILGTIVPDRERDRGRWDVWRG